MLLKNVDLNDINNNTITLGDNIIYKLYDLDSSIYRIFNHCGVHRSRLFKLKNLMDETKKITSTNEYNNLYDSIKTYLDQIINELADDNSELENKCLLINYSLIMSCLKKVNDYYKNNSAKNLKIDILLEKIKQNELLLEILDDKIENK